MKLTNDKEKVSYIIGEDIGSSLLKEGYDLDVNIMLEAIKAAASGKSENLLSENEKNEVMMRWQQEVNAKKQAAMAEQAKGAKKEGSAFLAQNRNNPGVFETPSGLQYQVLQGAEGKKPKATDTVHVHYHGTLLDGRPSTHEYRKQIPLLHTIGACIRRPSSRFDTRRQHFGIRCRTFGHKVVVRRHQNGISHSQFRAGRHAIWQRQCKNPRRSTKPSG